MLLASLRAWAIPALVALAMLAFVPAAFAHAQLQSSDPAENAVLDTAPETVRLVFNEPVSALRIDLIGPGGESTDLLADTQSGATTTIELPEGLVTGTHVLSWRVASTDGHPIGGSLIFSIGNITGTGAAVVSGDRAVAIALWGGKLVLFLALFIGVGGAAFGAMAALPIPAQRAAALVSLVGLLVAPLTLALQGLDALGLPLTAIFTAEAGQGGFLTSYGATAVCATLAFAAAVLALTIPVLSRWLGLFAYCLGALSLALSGHASAAEPQWLTRPAVFLHLAGILAWIGALLPLWLWLRDGSDEATRALARFSRYIPYAVGPLVLSGAVLAGIQLGWPGPHWFALYTGILAAKLVLLALLFGLAIWNRFRLTEPALHGNVEARHHLRRSIRAEAILVLLIAGLVAGWRFTPPPRALLVAEPAAWAEPILIHMMNDTTMVMATLTPGQAGPVVLDLAITDAEGEPLTPQAVAVTLAEPERGIEPIKRNAIQAGTDWRVDDLVIPVSGVWSITVDVRISRFSLTTLSGEADIPQ